MKRTQKEELIVQMREVFEQAAVGVLFHATGVSVAQTTLLRKSMNTVNAKVRVLHNRLSKRAIEHTSFQALAEHLKEQRTLIYGADPVGVAKNFASFMKDKEEKIRFIAAVLVSKGESTLLDAQQMDALSKLPSREELLAKLLGLMRAPQTQLVAALSDAPARLVRVLAAVQEKKSA